MSKLTLSKVKAEISQARREGRDCRIWDDNPKGLGLRIKPSGTATYFIQYLSPVTFKKARHTIGQHGRVTLDEARKAARVLFADIVKGADPNLTKKLAEQEAAGALTVSELCDDYLRDAKAGLVTCRGKPKKAGTLKIDEGRIERHIKPLLGKKLARDIIQADVERAMHDIRLGKTAINVKTKPRGRARVTGGAGTASRAVTLLGAIYTYAIKRNVRSDNPVSGVERPPDGRRTRTLSPDEYKALGKTLDALESKGSNRLALQAIRVLALTGCRKGEVLKLKSNEIDGNAGCLRFEDTKTGAQSRPVGRTALDILNKISDDERKYVFPASRGKGTLDGKKMFQKVFAEAKLNGVSAHVLRHSFASVALEIGYSELTIAGLLGHSAGSVTARYAHHVDRALVAAANEVSAVISSRMKGKKNDGKTVISFQNRRAGKG